MRGDHEQQAGMYSYISPEQRVPADHPLRPLRKMTDEIFKQLSPRFDKLYSRVGRPSIAPERLLRALLLQVLYSVRSERAFCAFAIWVSKKRSLAVPSLRARDSATEAAW